MTIRTFVVGMPTVAATVGWSRMAIASRLAGDRASQMPMSSTPSRQTRYTQNTFRSLTAGSLVSAVAFQWNRLNRWNSMRWLSRSATSAPSCPVNSFHCRMTSVRSCARARVAMPRKNRLALRAT